MSVEVEFADVQEMPSAGDNPMKEESVGHGSKPSENISDKSGLMNDSMDKKEGRKKRRLASSASLLSDVVQEDFQATPIAILSSNHSNLSNGEQEGNVDRLKANKTEDASKSEGMELVKDIEYIGQELVIECVNSRNEVLLCED